MKNHQKLMKKLLFEYSKYFGAFALVTAGEKSWYGKKKANLHPLEH